MEWNFVVKRGSLFVRCTAGLNAKLAGTVRAAVLFAAFYLATVSTAPAAVSPNPGDPLFCQPNENNSFLIVNGGSGVFTADPDCYNNNTNNDATLAIATSQGGTLAGTATPSGINYVYTPPTANFTGLDTFTLPVTTTWNATGGPGSAGGTRLARPGGPDTDAITLNVIPATTTLDVPSATPTMVPVPAGSITGCGAQGNAGSGPPPGTVSGCITGVRRGSIAPGHGTLTSVGVNALRYTPTAGYAGPDTFTYQALGINTDGTYALNSGDVTVQVTVHPGQSIGAFTFTPATLVVGGSTTAAATATSGLAVAFTSTTPGVCTVSGVTVTGVSAGTCTIAANQAGNSNYSAAPQVTKNITVAIPLVLTVSALPDGAVTTESTLNISGTVGNPAYLRTLTVNGAEVLVAANGSFSYPVQLLDGATTITTIATGTNGNTITDTRTITLDSSALQLAVTYPPDNKAVIQQAVTVTGTIAELFSSSAKITAKTALAAADSTMVVTYTINGGTPGTATLSDTTYSFTANLVSGMNTIQVSAANGTGKTAQAKRTVSYQPGFSLSVNDPANDIRTVQTSYLLKGAVADNSTPVSVAISMDGQTYTPAVDATGAFQQQLTFSSNKVYQVAVTGTDQNNVTLSVPRNIITVAAAAGSPFTVVDALLALRMSVGLVTPDQNQTLRLDVAPLVNGVSVGDGKVDIDDVVVILRKAIGLL